MSEQSFKLGTRWLFRDPNGNVVQGEDTLSVGVVNGEVWGDPQCTAVFIPLLVVRDGGREPTTVMVRSENILGKADNV